MSGGINTARQTGYDGEAGACQFHRQITRKAATDGGGAARTHNADTGGGEQFGAAFDAQKWRGSIDMTQELGIFRLANGHKTRADAIGICEILFGGVLGVNFDGATQAATRGEFGKGFEGGSCTAEAVDELAEGSGADILAFQKRIQSRRCSSSSRRWIAIESALSRSEGDGRFGSLQQANDILAMAQDDDGAHDRDAGGCGGGAKINCGEACRQNRAQGCEG